MDGAYMFARVSYPPGCPKCKDAKPMFIMWKEIGFLWRERVEARMGCTQCGFAFSAGDGAEIEWPGRDG
jgi:rubredoxin